MDDIKDIQVRNFSKFLDTEVRTDPFGENRSGDRAYRRTERLAAAIFLLTNHIDKEEELRKQVRSIALGLLEQVLALRDDMRTGNSNQVRNFQALVRQLISQIRMLVFGGFISSQNAEAVAGALDELGNFVNVAQRTHFSESIHFSQEELLSVREYSKGHIKDIKDRALLKDKQTVRDISTGATPQTPQSDLSSRAHTIIDILRTGGDMNIRDIGANMPEYGEKTIQRDIAALINRGLVKRSGLKRWSRYTLAS